MHILSTQRFFVKEVIRWINSPFAGGVGMVRPSIRRGTIKCVVSMLFQRQHHYFQVITKPNQNQQTELKKNCRNKLRFFLSICFLHLASTIRVNIYNYRITEVSDIKRNNRVISCCFLEKLNKKI